MNSSTVQINNHIQAAIARFMQQYLAVSTQYTINYPISEITLQVSGITGLLAAFVDQIQQLEDQAFSVNTGRQLYNGTTTPAVGAQLDGIGQLVGLNRNGLLDAEYILFLFGTIAANFSRGTYLDVFNTASYLFNSTQIYIQDYPPTSIAIQVAGSQLPDNLKNQAKAILETVPSGGVSILFVAETKVQNAFRYSSAVYPTPNVDNINNGYASVVDPVTYPGGAYVSVI